jgi:hypothetical protein
MTLRASTPGCNRFPAAPELGLSQLFALSIPDYHTPFAELDCIQEAGIVPETELDDARR